MPPSRARPGSTTPLVKISVPLDRIVNGQLGAITDAVAHEVIGAPDADERIFLRWILITQADQTDGSVVQLLSGGSVICTGFAASDGGGWSGPLPAEGPLVGALGEGISVRCLTASNVHVTLSGYRARD